MLWTVFGALLLAGAFVGLTVLENHARSHVSGKLEGRGGTIGRFTLEPNYCSSGAGMHGAELMRRDERFHWYIPGSEHKRAIVRVTHDPARGPLVSVELPGHPHPVVLDGSHCRRLSVVLHRPGASGRPGHFVDGSLSIDCDELVGSARFSGCY